MVTPKAFSVPSESKNWLNYLVINEHNNLTKRNKTIKRFKNFK